MCGSAMPPVNSAAISPLDAPASNIASWRSTESMQVAALAADLLGEGDPEQSLLARGLVQLARDRAGVLPLLEVRRHLAAHELGAQLTDLVRRHQQEVLLHVHDPRPHPLAEPLGLRVEPRRRGDALAEQAADDHVDRAEVRQHVDLDVEVRRLGHQLADLAGADELGEPGDPGVVQLLGGRACRASSRAPTDRRWRRRPCRRSARARRSRAAPGGSPSRRAPGTARRGGRCRGRRPRTRSGPRPPRDGRRRARRCARPGRARRTPAGRRRTASAAVAARSW